MTNAEAKAKLVAWCLERLGYAEGANNWNKYAPKWTAAVTGTHKFNVIYGHFS